MRAGSDQQLLTSAMAELVDEGVAYADRLRWAGVRVELDLVRGVTHDFIRSWAGCSPRRTTRRR
jgi:acetyl esterase/lipase